jgi:hypothetical protein
MVNTGTTVAVVATIGILFTAILCCIDSCRSRRKKARDLEAGNRAVKPERSLSTTHTKESNSQEMSTQSSVTFPPRTLSIGRERREHEYRVRVEQQFEEIDLGSPLVDTRKPTEWEIRCGLV